MDLISRLFNIIFDKLENLEIVSCGRLVSRVFVTKFHNIVMPQHAVSLLHSQPSTYSASKPRD